jgi:release factor glutamine methyltransferase
MSSDLNLRFLLGATPLPPNEARILMAHVLDKHYQLPRSALLSRDDMELDPPALEDWRSLESKRIEGQPIAYLIGKRGFHNIELKVAPGALIPRPETELLVELGLREIKLIESRGNKASLLDLGTGSGAIALAISHSAPKALISATDQSQEALKIAKKNAKYLGLDARVQFFSGSWYEALDKHAIFDIILSNPPYIAAGDPHLSQGDLRFEPVSALTDHASGLSCLEEIIRGSSNRLKPMGLVAVEHGFDQSAEVVALMHEAGLHEIQTHQDLAGHYRVVSGRK